MKGYAAVQAGDRATCAVVAAECEEFATAEGVPVVSAEASFLWVAAGQPERARALCDTRSHSTSELIRLEGQPMLRM
jgi:hypothetical protein